MRVFSKAILFAAPALIFVAAIQSINAQDAPDAQPLNHFVLTRSFAAEDVPHYIPAADVANDARSMPLQACDGQTYYLTDVDAEFVQEEVAAGDAVQLYEASQGASPTDAAVVCLFSTPE